MDYSERLEKSKSVIEIFDLVKDAVKDTIRESRAGINLGFIEMGNSDQCIFAFHPIGSNIIVMNKTPIRRLIETKPELIKPYIFSTLIHEYIHSLGYIDETDARKLTCQISGRIFAGHITAKLSCGLEEYFTYLIYPEGFPQLEEDIQVIEEDQNYIE